MQHPTAFLTLRPHAEGRPEDAALEPFPLEERILVVLAQQPWASAANLAKRLDVSESDIHKACHELEENKKLIAGRDRLITELRLSGATTFEQARAVLKQFLPRFNRRFGVPAQCPEPVSRASVPSQCPEPVSRASVPSQCPEPVSRASVPSQCPEPVSRARIPALAGRPALGTSPVLQAPQESNQAQHSEVPEAHPAAASRSKAPQLCRGGCGGAGRTGRPAVSAA